MSKEKKKLHNLDSDEEWYFSWYILELLEAGMIHRYEYHPKSYTLSPSASYTYEKQLKTKIVEKKLSLFQKYSYTTDFLVFWKEAARNIFFQSIMSKIDLRGVFFKANDVDMIIAPYSVIEIKADFSDYNMLREFVNKQKVLYSTQRIYAQKVIVSGSKNSKEGVFQNTFTPERFLLTDTTKRKKVLHYKTKTIQEFIGERRLN